MIDNYISAIDECEYERYAPGDEKGNMKRTLDAAMKAIADMEETVKEIEAFKQEDFQLLLPYHMHVYFLFAVISTNKG